MDERFLQPAAQRDQLRRSVAIATEPLDIAPRLVRRPDRVGNGWEGAGGTGGNHCGLPDPRANETLQRTGAELCDASTEILLEQNAQARVRR